MNDRPISADDLFADLDEFEGYDDVTGPHDLALGAEYDAFGAPEDPDFWVDDSPSAAQRLTGAVRAIRDSRTASKGIQRPATPAPRRPIPRSAARPARRNARPDAQGTRPLSLADRVARLPGLGTPFARRIALIAATVLMAAPVVSALRPTGAEAENASGQAATLAVGTSPSTDAPLVLLNPGAGEQQAPTGTIDMSALPLLDPDGDASSPVTAQSSCSGRYTVVSGDSWSLIADKVSVSVSSLLDVNDATTSTMLHVGDVLCLPKGASSPTTNAPVTTKAPSTTVKTTTTVAAPSGPYYSPAQIEAIIRDVWPDNLEDTALMIAIRESKLNPYVHNWCCYGLFQIYWEVHDVWLIPRGVTSAAQLYDPRTNATAAYWIYQRSGSFAPWGM